MLIILILLLISSAVAQTSGGASLSNITISQGTPLSVTTSACPAAVEGAAYTCTLTATGGTFPYNWSLVSRRIRFLPVGLTLASNGTISGSPSAPGLSNFVIQVQDSSAPIQTASVTLSINVVGASACGFPRYACARSDWAAQVLDTMTAKPPDMGPNTCVPGMDNHLQACGNLTGINTVQTDPNYGVRVLRVTDYTDTTTTPGCAFPIYIGPGGAAGLNVFSNDSQYFVIGCGGGAPGRIKWLDTAAFQINNCAHRGNPPLCNAVGEVTNSSGVIYQPSSTPRFLYTVPETFIQLNGTVVQRVSISNGIVSSAPTDFADWANAVPCWSMAVGDCPDWQASHVYQPGSNIYPTVNNAANKHSLQLINFASCTSGASSPDWATAFATSIGWVNATVSGPLANYGLTWVITDGDCQWMDADIPPNATGGKVSYTTGLAGNLIDTQVWQAMGNGNGEFTGQDGRGSCYIVWYDSVSNRYSQLNTCTGNVYNTACSGGTTYACTGGTFQRTFVGNIYRDSPPSRGFRATTMHSLWLNMAGTWTDFPYKNCSLRDYNARAQPTGAGAAIYCSGNFNLNTYMWTVGTHTYTDAWDWLQSLTIGHDVVGYNAMDFSAGAARTLRDKGPYVNRTWGEVGTNFDRYSWILDTSQPNTQTCTPSACWAAGINTTQCGSAVCRVIEWDQHSSWTSNDGSDATPICTWVYANKVDMWPWPHRWPWLEELVCYATDGSNRVSRELYPWNTQLTSYFNVNSNIWSMSRDGKYAGVTSDWWCTLGKIDGTPSNLCAAKFQENHAYAADELLGPWYGPQATATSTTGTGQIFKVTTAGTSTTAAATSWCTTTGCTVSSGTAVFTRQGMADARSDVFLVELK